MGIAQLLPGMSAENAADDGEAPMEPGRVWRSGGAQNQGLAQCLAALNALIAAGRFGAAAELALSVAPLSTQWPPPADTTGPGNGSAGGTLSSDIDCSSGDKVEQEWQVSWLLAAVPVDTVKQLGGAALVRCVILDLSARAAPGDTAQ
jgi:hypothetical protein